MTVCISNAFADLLIGAIVMPLALYQETYSWPNFVPCEAWVALDVTCCTASCMSLMVISLDRLYTCVRPIPADWYSDKMASIVILGKKTGSSSDDMSSCDRKRDAFLD